MSENYRRFWAGVLNYLGLESSEEHDYPGHICGVDCDRQPSRRFWNDPRRGSWYVMGIEYFVVLFGLGHLIGLLFPALPATRYDRFFVAEVAFVLIWLGMRRLTRRMAELSHREANRLVWVTKATRTMIWAHPAFWVFTSLVIWVMSLFHL